MRDSGHKPASEEYSHFAGKGPFQKGDCSKIWHIERWWQPCMPPVLKVLTLYVPTTQL